MLDNAPTRQLHASVGAASAVVEMSDADLSLDAASGRVDILSRVTFSAARGESVAVVGPSGSGKSSLLSVAAGLERATGGVVRLLGADLRALSEGALARLRRGRVGFVFQSFHLLETLNAFDNVRAPLEIAGVANAVERAHAALARVGLTNRERHYPGQLSGGERQRVAVARALAPDPEVVFADEPTGNLDSASGAMVADLLFAIAAERGATLILVTHDHALAARAHRIVALDDGRILP